MDEIATTLCAICFTDYTREFFPSEKLTAQCTHESNMCFNCIAESIRVQQYMKMWTQLNCPACTLQGKISLLPDETIRRHANEATWKRHELLVARHAMQENPNFVWCLSGKCEWGELHDPNSERFICSTCGFHTCFKHQVPWHQGITCRQYDGLDPPPQIPKPAKQKRTPGLRNMLHTLLRNLIGKSKPTEGPAVVIPAEVLEAQKTAALMAEASRTRGKALKARAAIGKLSKKCPGRGCGVPIERSSGCSRMRCGRCGCDFCFTCLSLWEYGHYTSCNDAVRVGLQARRAPRLVDA